MAAPVAAISAELVSQFCVVTGSNDDEARKLLEACDGNLDMAIGLHMDNCDVNPRSAANASDPQTVPSLDDDLVEENVRAPIPQRQEVLVETQPTFLGFRGRRKRGRKSVFDGFRDFQREARLQQERNARGDGPSTSRSSLEEKRDRLEDLFRPPLDLLFNGTFEGAKDHGSSENKWLMVNVQNVQEFCCQMLNRDVWSNDAVKAIVREHFVLWQVYHDSEEGQRFSQFYKPVQWPYIAILDPRTGESMSVWNNVDAVVFCDLASDFLTAHPCLDGEAPPEPQTKRRRLSECIVDADEETQLAAAIKQSLRESDLVKQIELSDDNSDCELETFSDSDSEKPVPKRKPDQIRNGESSRTFSWGSMTSVREVKEDSNSRSSFESLKAIARVSAHGDAGADRVVDKVKEEEKSPECWQRLLGPDTDAVTRLVLRLPDGGRVEVKWPCSSPVEALHEYVDWMGYPLSRYEILTNYPRRILSTLPVQQTLKECGLHPQETVFIQERDS